MRQDHYKRVKLFGGFARFFDVVLSVPLSFEKRRMSVDTQNIHKEGK